MTIEIQRRLTPGIAVLTRNATAMKELFEDAGIAHRLLVLQDDVSALLPLFHPPLVLDTSTMSIMELAHVLHQLTRASVAFPTIAIVRPGAFSHLRLLASCPAICAVFGFPVDAVTLLSVLRYVRTLTSHDTASGMVWLEVPPLDFDRRIGVTDLLVALDGASCLGAVQERMYISRATLRRRLMAVASMLGITATYNQPHDWQQAILLALGMSPLIG